MKKSKKNISKKVPIGLLVHTNDKYFYKSDGYAKSRMAVVIDSNRDDKLALVKLTTSEKGVPISNYRSGKSRFKTGELYTLDDEANSISLSNRDINNNRKFIPDYSTKKRMSMSDVNYIKRVSINDNRFGVRNRSRLRKMKGRK